jgi:Ca2+-binding EF-hand superfamily protein
MILKKLLDWILEKKFTLSEAFTMIDSDFDGTISLKDLSDFLENTLKVDISIYNNKVERLFRFFDLSKAGKVYLVDFQKIFS